MPLYESIAAEVAERIASEQMLPGDRIESELRLSMEFNVSRGTVVKAMDLLERQGLVRRQQGRGTFVHGRPALRSTTDLVSFTSQVEALGGSPGGRLLDWSVVEATEEDARHRPFELGLLLVDFSRLRTIDGVPVGIHRVLVPNDLAENVGLVDQFRTGGDWSLYDLFRRAGVHLGRGDEQFSAALADPREADLLSVERPAALLQVERHTYDLVGRPVELVEARYLSDRYSVHAESTRNRFASPRISTSRKEES